MLGFARFLFLLVLVGFACCLVLLGVAQMLSPTPSAPKFEEAQQLESFTFSGIVNTARQGGPVPIVLGRAYAGSVVISSGLDVEQ